MFRSFKYIGYDTKSIKYEITDSNFVVVATVYGVDAVAVEVAVAKAYIRRNLPVARNIALLCLYLEARGNKMADVIYWQNKYCPEHIANWAEIAAERDRVLNKLSAMK